jgi:1-pyrroline-5-carboxylate dehydrogenase
MGTAQQEGLSAALDEFQKKAPLEVPLVVGGKKVRDTIFKIG